MKQLLITGFDPFGGEAVNPSWEAVRRLPDTIGPYYLTKLQIPTIFGRASEMVLAAMTAPDVILCIGQAGGRSAVTPEKIAVNIRDARAKGTLDNAGFLATGEKIIADAPAAYFSTLPVEAMARAICASGLPGAVSNTAGTFVCNDTLFTLLHHFAGTGTRVGFVHVPWLPQQAKEGAPSMELRDIIAALSAVISALE